MKYLLIALSLILSACAEEPTRSFYQSQRVTGWQDENGKIHLVGVASTEPVKPITITGEPMRHEKYYDPFAFASRHADNK
jgi:hypothetical protein